MSCSLCLCKTLLLLITAFVKLRITFLLSAHKLMLPLNSPTQEERRGICAEQPSVADTFLTLNAQGSSVLSVFGRCFSPKGMAAGSVREGPLIGSPAVNANGLCRLKSVGVPTRSDAIPLVIPALRAQSCPLEYPAGVLMDVLLDLPSDLNPTMDPSLDLLSPVEMTPKQSAEAAAEAAVGSSSFREAAESAMSGPVPSEAVSLGVEEGLRLSSAAVGGSFQEAAGEVTRAEVAAPVPSDRAATEGAAQQQAQECSVQELTRPMSDPVSTAVTRGVTLVRCYECVITGLPGSRN